MTKWKKAIAFSIAWSIILAVVVLIQSLPVSPVYQYLEAMDASAREVTFLAVFLAIPFDVLFITLSSRNYGHYFITLLPSVVFACSYLFGKLIDEVSIKSIGQAASLGFVGSLLMVWCIPALISIHPQRQHLASLLMLGDKSLAQDNIAAYVESHTRPGESVLVWQVRPELNLITNRPAPSKYIYPLPLFVENGGKQSRFEEFLKDVEMNRPELIVLYEKDTSLPALDAPDDELCPSCIPEALEGMRKLKLFVQSNYAIATELDGTRIYEKVK